MMMILPNERLSKLSLFICALLYPCGRRSAYQVRVLFEESVDNALFLANFSLLEVFIFFYPDACTCLGIFRGPCSKCASAIAARWGKVGNRRRPALRPGYLAKSVLNFVWYFILSRCPAIDAEPGVAVSMVGLEVLVCYVVFLWHEGGSFFDLVPCHIPWALAVSASCSCICIVFE